MNRLILAASITLALNAQAELLNPAKDAHGDSCGLDPKSIEFAGSKKAPIVAFASICHDRKKGSDKYAKFSVSCNSAQTVATEFLEVDSITGEVLGQFKMNTTMGTAPEGSLVEQYAEVVCGYARNTDEVYEKPSPPRVLGLTPPKYE